MSFVMDDGDVFNQYGGIFGVVWFYFDNSIGVNIAFFDVLCVLKDSCRVERNL